MAVDNLSTGRVDVFAGFGDDRFRFEEADLLIWMNLKREVKLADRIYHMAAVVEVVRVLREPIEVSRVNVLGTEHLLEYVSHTKELPEVVIASSSSVYGHSHQEALDEQSELIYRPEQGGFTGYAMSKLHQRGPGQGLQACPRASRQHPEALQRRRPQTIRPLRVCPPTLHQAGALRGSPHRLRRRHPDALLLQCPGLGARNSINSPRIQRPGESL